MNAIPAQVAGVKEIVIVSPPDKETGRVSPLVLAAAQILGIDEIYALGGAQAVAALAYGTESIHPVDKITGPGNQWVTEAKRQVFGQTGIDSLAGPSEIVIVADESADPSCMAADLLSQAEHDTLARAVLISWKSEILDMAEKELERQVSMLPRQTIARQALKNGAFIHVKDLEEAITAVNTIAPEHLEFQVSNAETMLPRVIAGAVFIGPFTPEPVGDYWAGCNHILPTGGTARFASALSVRDFMRWTSVMRYDLETLRRDREAIANLARLEGLEAHARSVEARFPDLQTEGEE
jgi:histidinol dehydrogenase